MFQKPTHTLLLIIMVVTGLLGSFRVAAQEVSLSDSATVTLITVSPGTEIYAHYGHTAIRVADPANGIDWVFNYGLFDFNSPNFIYRFVRGETDYLCGAFDYTDFLLEYRSENRDVYEQVLGLKKAEKAAVWQALVRNIQPENRTYRYNFFFNNCSTKPRDVVMNSIQGKVDYRTKGYYPTLRSVLHQYTKPYPWTQFGIDFLIGAQADRPASLSDQQFAPELLFRSFSTAVVTDSAGKTRPLVLETRQAVSRTGESLPTSSSLPGPVTVCWILFIVTTATTVMEYRKKRPIQALTAVWYGLAGLVGCLIAFLALFSIHPTTHVNYLLLWLNPLHLIFAFGMIFETFRKKILRTYLSINLFLQLVALSGFFFLPQQLHPAMWPLLLTMLMRTALGARITTTA
jgi:hypothetical protein